MTNCFAGTAPLVVALALALPAASAAGEAKPVDWSRGPTTVDVGTSVAQLELDEGLLYAGREDTRRLLEQMGNAVGRTEVGLAAPAAEGEDWFVVFEWDPIGLVKDDEAHQIDAAALLDSIKRGTEEANERRGESGVSPLHVEGWVQAPRYDAATHNLTWSIRARSENGHEVVNHNVRLLGRAGVMSVTLVASPEEMTSTIPRLDAMLRRFSFKQGGGYAEWVPGDKVAEYGLTGLVAAGAGAAAVKLGFFAALGKFLAKGWKLVLLALAGLAGGIGKLWGRLGGRRPAEVAAPTPLETAAVPPPPSGGERSSGPGFGEGGPPR